MSSNVTSLTHSQINATLAAQEAAQAAGLSLPKQPDDNSTMVQVRSER
jgi:hypothetical protein